MLEPTEMVNYSVCCFKDVSIHETSKHQYVTFCASFTESLCWVEPSCSQETMEW